MTPAKVERPARPWGAYVHFPWCLKKCPYCDFLSIPVEPRRLGALAEGVGEAQSVGEVGASERRAVSSKEGLDREDLGSKGLGAKGLGSTGLSSAGLSSAGLGSTALGREGGPLRLSLAPPLDAPAARRALPHAAYADAVLGELDARLPWLEVTSRPDSIFFGGGTPSLWEPEQLGRVVAALSRWPGTRGPSTPSHDSPGRTGHPEELEVTVECNPTSFDEDHARRLLEAGVNRVSLGVQSLDQSRLEFLGRLHDAQGALAAIAAARRAGVPRISADVIFGVAGQSPAQAADEVRRLAATGITHLSAYALTIESNTQFGVLAGRGQLPLLDDGLVAESFVAVEEVLEQEGFRHYEVSNYAREDHVARHNLGYWRGYDYLGLGTGAWGTVRLGERPRLRYRNTPSVERYLRLWTGEQPADPFAAGAHVTDREVIGAETELSERLLLGLRLDDGLDVSRVEAELGVPLWTPERKRARDKLLRSGRLELDGDRLRVPRSQWLFADGIIAELL